MRIRSTAGLLVPALLATLTGCPSAEYVVAIDVRTDLQPGTEFILVRTEIASGSASWDGARRIEVGAFSGEDHLRGRRVAEIRDAAQGLARVRVSLIDAAAAVVVRRTVSVEVRGSTVVTVVLTRLCTGVDCPAAGDDPAATTCANGRCVAPECAFGGSEPGCPDAACETDADCSAAACADVSCGLEACLVRPRDEYCGDGERCDAVRGCVPGTGGDCSPEGSSCDDGDPCTSTDLCTGGTCAGESYACTPGACETSECDGEGGCDITPSADCCGNGSCDAGETCTSCAADCSPCCGDGACDAGETCLTCAADCGSPMRVCDSCRRWDCCVVLGSVTRYDGDCSTCTPCDACAMASSCHTCAHPMGGDCRYDTQECNVRYEECNCRDECP